MENSSFQREYAENEFKKKLGQSLYSKFNIIIS